MVLENKLLYERTKHCNCKEPQYMKSRTDNELWIFSGVPAAGKTTTSKAFAKRFAHAAVISRDDLQDQILSGNVRPDGLPIEEASFQMNMNVRNQCALAKSYLQHGFTAICDEVVGEHQLDVYKELLKDYEIHLVTLNPTLDLAAKRDKQRSNETQFYVDQSKVDRGKMLHKLILTVADKGLWIDNSNMTVEETISYILKNKEDCILKH